MHKGYYAAFSRCPASEKGECGDRIGYESLVFARVHQEVNEAYGHRLLDVPAGPVRERVALIEKHVTCLA